MSFACPRILPRAALAPETEILGRAIGEILAQRLAATPYADEEE